jgi:Cu/Zn superoxide dismutase
MLNFTVDAKGKADAKLEDKDVTSATERTRSSATAARRSSSTPKPTTMKTDPSGNSGDRIACGVVTK